MQEKQNNQNQELKCKNLKEEFLESEFKFYT